jgi:hypothetical protein
MNEPAKVEALERIPLTLAPAAPFGRPLFLRWLCIATASGLVLATLAAGGFAAGVSGAPLGVALVIVGSTAALVAFAGTLHWRADTVIESGNERQLEHLRHDAQLVYYAVALFQVLGMIGARSATASRPTRRRSPTVRRRCTR